jgi:hypothetical protein
MEIPAAARLCPHCNREPDQETYDARDLAEAEAMRALIAQREQGRKFALIFMVAVMVILAGLLVRQLLRGS